MLIINGKELAKSRELFLREKAGQFFALNHRKPSLVAIELSDDPSSKLYLKLKRAAAERIGIKMTVMEGSHPSNWKDANLPEADAIFIQHPPRQKLQEIVKQHGGGQVGFTRKQVDVFWQRLADQIPPPKDVDCLTSENLNLIKQGKPRFLPATVKAVLYCLENALRLERPGLASQGRALSKKHVVILGRSPILGLPLSWHLNSFGCKVDVIHSKTDIKNQKSKIKNADIIISAIGKPHYITGDMVKTSVIAIDCGSPVGDFDFDSVSQKAAAITLVPGGVGPLTVVSLMENVVEAAMLQYPHHADREGS